MICNRREIFRKAHFAARWRCFNNPRTAYREAFAAALRAEYAAARRRAEWRALAPQREALRASQNWGAPIRSFRGEKAFFRSRRDIAAVGA